MKKEIREKALSILMFVIVLSYTNLTMSDTWRTIYFPPGASYVSPRGIDGDNIVGTYFDWDIVRNRGFLYDGMNWTSLNYPGARHTYGGDIDGDNIVGSYIDAGSNRYGYLYDGTNWTKLDYPGASTTIASGIDDGIIVGDYEDTDGHWHGFIYDGVNWTTLDKPGAEMTLIGGIDGDNIVGSYYDESGGHGFLYDGTCWMTLDYPGASKTVARGIDGDNVVGYWYDGSWTGHGFLYDGTSWTTLEYPGAAHTYAQGIDGDNIVGSYDDGIDHVFICTIQRPILQVAVDIKPQACPNPLNVKSQGVLPVAILGTEDVNVLEIVPTSIELAGVGAIRNAYEDVAAPVSDTNDCNCTTDGQDGFLDLTLKFNIQDIVKTICELNDGDILPLLLTGELFDGTPIDGADCVLIKGKHFKKADINEDGVIDFLDYAFFANHYGLTDCNDFNDCDSTDLDFSGIVDPNDLDIFSSYWMSCK
ncbi:MAG: hypothetical protein ACYSUK_10050 [Planctomycetota bacterium]|jgi:hypothetical protein